MRSAEAIDRLSKTRLSKHFLLRDFLFSAEAAAAGQTNMPENWDQVIKAGRELCERVLEPLIQQFGPLSITFGYQSRPLIDRQWTRVQRERHALSSAPHQWDRGTFGTSVYARVDILPLCVDEGAITKCAYGRWAMYNLDIDLLMQWTRSNVFCVTIGPQPRRVWLEWGRPSLGEPRQTVFMGSEYWTARYPLLPQHERPRFGPSSTKGKLQWITAA